MSSPSMTDVARSAIPDFLFILQLAAGSGHSPVGRKGTQILRLQLLTSGVHHTSDFIKTLRDQQAPVVKPKCDVQYPQL